MQPHQKMTNCSYSKVTIFMAKHSKTKILLEFPLECCSCHSGKSTEKKNPSQLIKHATKFYNSIQIITSTVSYPSDQRRQLGVCHIFHTSLFNLLVSKTKQPITLQFHLDSVDSNPINTMSIMDDSAKPQSIFNYKVL